MEFINKSLTDYTEQHTSAESELLQRVNRETNLEVLMPRMLSGHLQGRVLSMLSKMVNPSYIVEVGTYTGYSALCLVEGLREGGKLVTIEFNKELRDRIFQPVCFKACLQKYIPHQFDKFSIKLFAGNIYTYSQ